MTEIKNGDKVKYRMGLTFTYVGKDPYKEGHSYCIHPTTSRLDSLPTEDLSTFLGHDYTDEQVIQKILSRKR